MTDQKDQAQPAPVATVHVVNGVGTSISTTPLPDGTYVGMLKFIDSAGKEFGLTFPVSSLPALSAMLLDLTVHAKKRQIGLAGTPVRWPNTFGVASDNERFRGCVLVGIDPELPSEVIYVLKDAAALEFAKQIRNEALNHMTPQQRMNYEAGLMRPSGPRIFMPGR